MLSLYEAVAANDVDLVRSLLDAGIDTDDNESVYHSTEHRDLQILRLLIANGAKVHGTNALNHMLDREDPEGVNLLLSAGADPNADHSLHWSIFRRRGPEVVKLLLDAGALIGPDDYANAVVVGRLDVAALLEQRGANPTLSPLERALGYGEPVPPFDGRADLMPAQASMRQIGNVRRMLDSGFPIDARGREHGATAMHWACWKGDPDLARLLLERGTSLTILDTSFQATPLGWLDHASRTQSEPAGDHNGVRRVIDSTLPKTFHE